AVERAADELLRQRYPDRPLRANVEFYTAVLLDAVGLERSLFPAVFACGRVAGWLGHVAEQRATGPGSSAPPPATWGRCRAESVRAR
ncbi:MAG TPA: citrate/2-methylcitrate synthase, partial [Cystobacter sp.]